MKLYLAGKYQSRLQLVEYAKELVSNYGHEITSRWLDGSHDGFADALTSEVRQRFALEDLEDLMAADAVLFFSPPQMEPGRGGRHVEFGIAYQARKILVVIGPKENVFHDLPGVMHFPEWADFALMQQVQK